ncbi:MAG: VPLPA-CTERM sorting domain-containing protein [Proteobacteria bacterium]|nr:VPLPA-CTERM sorting domain-containing protein [Pseudomonadota bacterium]
MRKAWIAHGILVLAALLGAVSPAAASSVLVDASYSVTTAGAVAVNNLHLSGPGTLTLSLTDLHWPASLQDLRYLITTADGTILGQGSGAGSFSIAISSAELVYAVTFGQATPLPGLSFGYGSYGVQIGFQPVPLPDALVLLGSGLGALAIVARRRRDPMRPVAINL